MEAQEVGDNQKKDDRRLWAAFRNSHRRKEAFPIQGIWGTHIENHDPLYNRNSRTRDSESVFHL